MLKEFLEGFWATTARIILRNRILILLALTGMTIFLGMQWEKVNFSNAEVSVLPNDHPAIVQYQSFVDLFGQEDNALVLAVKDPALFTPENFRLWNRLSKEIHALVEIDTVISLDNLQELVREKDSFLFQPLIRKTPSTIEAIDSIKQHLFEELPFYENLVYNKETGSIRMVAYLDKQLLDEPIRNDFILNDLANPIKNFEEETGLDVKVSGMPYVRTWNAKTITDEISYFVLAALGVTSLIFFFFFRSFRATLISMCVVIIGVMWAFGIMGLLGFEITILTALIPPLIIVIGIPNCIFLINKYQQEVKKHGNQALSLQRVICKIGNATLMTNVTTASGFATFIILDSLLLKEFGIVASLNILGIFVLSLLIIPIIYSFMPLPKTKHLKHLNTSWIDTFVSWMERLVRDHRIAVYVTSLIVLIMSIIGIYQIKITGSRIEDLPKETHFFEDIQFFEEEYNGIMPVEVVVNTKREKGVMKPATLNRMNDLAKEIEETPELSTPLSVINLVKYSKQAYYSGIPKFYQMPSSQERSFITDAIRRSFFTPVVKDSLAEPGSEEKRESDKLMEVFMDSTQQITRMTTFMRDVKTDRMEEIEKSLYQSIDKIFPSDRYDVYLTGKALLFLKGTKYLVNNLLISLALAIGLISLFMAYLFRSFRMIIISLIPNLLPLLITAGLMGYLGVPIKPSTILVFSIAFGISVDDTIHFLAKYRQELTANRWQIKKSVYAALRETGVSMFYTSIVLFFGFSVFVISSYGGTVALGALVSATLLFAMLANLVLLPSLLLSLERNIANKKVFKKPHINILEEEEVPRKK